MDAEALVFVDDDDAPLRESLKNLIRSVGLRVEGSMKVHRQHVMAKMGACSLAALVRMADRLGIPTPQA